MLKVLAFFKKHPDLTSEQFKMNYETVYSVLAKPYVFPEVKRYVRRYIEPLEPVSEGSKQDLGFDVMTEMWFESREDYDTINKRLHEGEVREKLLEEQKKLFDNLEPPVFLVTEECDTHFNAEVNS